MGAALNCQTRIGPCTLIGSNENTYKFSFTIDDASSSIESNVAQPRSTCGPANSESNPVVPPQSASLTSFPAQETQVAFLQSRHNQDTSDHFEKPRGSLGGFHSIRVNKQWRGRLPVGWRPGESLSIRYLVRSQ
jgi:hypothetical protein